MYKSMAITTTKTTQKENMVSIVVVNKHILNATTRTTQTSMLLTQS